MCVCVRVNQICIQPRNPAATTIIGGGSMIVVAATKTSQDTRQRSYTISINSSISVTLQHPAFPQLLFLLGRHHLIYCTTLLSTSSRRRFLTLLPPFLSFIGAYVCVCARVCICYLAHNRAIRPGHPSHSILLALVLYPKEGSIMLVYGNL